MNRKIGICRIIMRNLLYEIDERVTNTGLFITWDNKFSTFDAAEKHLLDLGYLIKKKEELAYVPRSLQHTEI